MAGQDQISCEAAVAAGQCPEERREVQEEAAPAAVAAPAGGEEKTGSACGKPPAKDVAAGVSLARAILQLPTPARNQARSAAQGSDGARKAAELTPKTPGLVGGSSASTDASTSASTSASADASTSASTSASSTSSSRSIEASVQGKAAGTGVVAAPAKPPRGPEPWSAGDASQGTAAKTGGYREYLQARGQQAMQRSRLRGAAAGVPPPPPGPPMLAFDPAAACGTPTGGWSPAAATAAAARSPTAVAAWGIPGEMQVHQAAQPWLQPNAFGMPPILPAGMRQPPQYPQAMMEAVAPQGPQFCYAHPQASAPCSRASSKSCVGSPIGEDLMATFMPEAFAMDRDQLAEQLRAAASCSYDD